MQRSTGIAQCAWCMMYRQGVRFTVFGVREDEPKRKPTTRQCIQSLLVTYSRLRQWANACLVHTRAKLSYTQHRVEVNKQ